MHKLKYSIDVVRLHALLVFPYIVLIGVAEVYIVKTFVFLPSAKQHIEPCSDLLGHML